MNKKFSVILTLIELLLFCNNEYSVDFIVIQTIKPYFIITIEYLLEKARSNRKELEAHKMDYSKTEIQLSSWLYMFREKCDFTMSRYYKLIIGNLSIKHESRNDSSYLK